MTKTQMPVFTAVRCRSLAVQAEVMAKKIGMPPNGSTMGNSARNVAAAECGSVRRNCPRACAVFIALPVSLQHLRSPFERRSQNRQLLPRLSRIPFVESFVHSRNHHRRI